MKTYSLIIVYDDTGDEIEYIEEEITEDAPDVYHKITSDPEQYDDETLKDMLISGMIIGES